MSVYSKVKGVCNAANTSYRAIQLLLMACAMDNLEDLTPISK